jgi:metal-sulfur cluster biosynthetic enzyme
MSQDIQQTRRLIFDELSKIVDPEIGVSIMELELVDQVDIKEKDVNVDLHLTSPFCPAVFGFKIAQDVRDNIYRIHGIENVKINVSNHFMAEAINKQVNESKPPSKQQQEEIEVEGEGEKEQEQEQEQEQEKPMNERKQQ